jgi:hypothetical protein
MVTSHSYFSDPDSEESGTQGLFLAHLASFTDIPLVFGETTIDPSQSLSQVEGSPPSPTKAELCLMLSSCHEICGWACIDRGSSHQHLALLTKVHRMLGLMNLYLRSRLLN